MTPPRHDPSEAEIDGTSWVEHRIHILRTMSDQKDWLKELDDKLVEVEKENAASRAIALLWGAMAGVVVSIVIGVIVQVIAKVLLK